MSLLPAGAGGVLVKLHLVGDVEVVRTELEKSNACLSFRGCSLGLIDPREDRPRPWGTVDFDILGSGTTGRQDTVSIFGQINTKDKKLKFKFTTTYV